MSEPHGVRIPYREELTPRQREVLQLIAQGRTNYDIATALGISLDGAKWHVREILGRLGCESREEAAAWWRAYNRPAAKLSRLFAPLFVAKGIAFVGVAAAAAAVALVAVLATRGGDSPSASTPVATLTPAPQASATAVVLTPTPSPSPLPGAVRTCDTSAVQLAVREETLAAGLGFVVSASSQTPCTLDATVRVQLMPGAPTQPTIHGLSVKVVRDISSVPTDVAAMTWGNSCGSATPSAAPSPYALRLTWQEVRGGQVTFTPPVAAHAVMSNVPPCAEPSGLSPALPPGQAPPTPGPVPALPGGLERTTEVSGRIDVRLRPGGTASGATGCWELATAMLTTDEYATGERGTVASCDTGENAWRFTFGRDAQGVYVLHRIELLLIAYDTLPDGLTFADCNEIRPYLVPAAEDPANAGYVLVCGASTQSAGRGPLEVWARLPKDNLPASIPAGTKCWELSRYLGPPRGAETTPVKCVLE